VHAAFVASATASRAFFALLCLRSVFVDKYHIALGCYLEGMVSYCPNGETNRDRGELMLAMAAICGNDENSTSGGALGCASCESLIGGHCLYV